ncbi:MarR family transcriptional regulator [Devosia oryziradicis]|uniref:MarR family transcriptional regulator n=1 Tax=Devosia oryziradicis TaxID=2801335 RepID=A0ABX7BYQ0_9HYPH|nr:MarR family transcriptional regulator [Devosia oryziradicis]QQR37102.1 MarR family transcriptional regulator [Devosia oryziradicis]
MPTVASPSPAEDALETGATASIVGYRLRRAQLSVFQKFHAVFEELKLRPAEYSVLVLIADNPGRKQTEIAEALGIKRANFVTLVHGLEERGLVERVPSANDRRANALHLTRAGEAFLAHARAVHTAMEDELVARLGGAQARDRLLALLDRLT